MFRVFLLAGFCVAFVPAARGDLSSDFLRSLDWMIDASDVIVIVEIQQQGKQKLAHTVKVLKATGKRNLKNWPQTELADLTAKLPVGRPLLIFGRHGKDGAPRVVDLVCLSEVAPPKGMPLKTAHSTAATGGMEAAAKLGICAAINKDGKLLTRPKDVLDLVNKRLARGSRVPADCNRDRVERPYSGDRYGGGWHGGSTPFDSNEVLFSVLVPWEPEDEQKLLNELQRAEGSGKATVVERLANYRTRKTIAALRACLKDDHVETKTIAGVDVSVYPVRVAAAQCLRKFGIEVRLP